MKALTVNSFWIDQLTGRALVEITGSLGNDLNPRAVPFSSAEIAKAAIDKEKRDWLLAALEQYVNHKRHIIETAGMVPEAQRRSLQICTQAIVEYEKRSLPNICAGFLKGMAHFNLILPNPNNNSHAGSLANLEELIKFCQTEIKQ